MQAVFRHLAGGGGYAQALCNSDHLNKVVYRDVFLAAIDDPWYGLKTDAYTGLEDDPAGRTAQPAAEAGGPRKSR